MDVDSWLAFGATSGAVAGATNQLLGLIRDSLGHRALRRAQTIEREHQSLLRSEAAHAEARERYLPMIQECRDWNNREWAQRFGMEVGYHGTNSVQLASCDVGDVLRNLDRVATGHPTRGVRELASALHTRIDESFNTVDGAQSSEPSAEDFEAWNSMLLELAESLLCNPPLRLE